VYYNLLSPHVLNKTRIALCMRQTPFSSFQVLSLALIIALNISGFIFPLGSTAAHTIWFVDATASGSNTGETWQHAFTDLQDALSAASTSDQIWVAAGVYKPSSSGDRSMSFSLKSNVAIYGGFAGSETQLSQRNWTNNLTILSGDLAGDDTTDASNIVTDTSKIAGNNSFHVITSSNLDNSAVLDGFIVTAGNANDTTPNNLGGGLLNTNSSPTLSNLIFSGNNAGNGGAIANTNGNPLLSNIRFIGNSATNGGAIANIEGDLTIIGGTFTNNSSTSSGGAIYALFSDTSLSNTSFLDNSATNGGAIYNNTGDLELQNTTLTTNTALENGGAIYTTALATLSFTSVTFSKNTATNDGGGIYSYEGTLDLTSVDFSENTATNGGGLYSYASKPTLKAVTFSENTATNGGGLSNTNSSTMLLTNASFIRNSAVNGGAIFNVNGTTLTLSNTLAIHLFNENSATGNGGAIYNANGSITSLNNTTIAKSSAIYGGAIYNTGGSEILLNQMVLSHNESTSDGGAIYSNNSSKTTISASTLADNSATGNGGAIFSTTNSPVTLTNVTITNNSATAGNGGALYNSQGSHPTLNNVRIAGNKASGNGGAFYTIQGSTLNFTNGLISGNHSEQDGSAFYGENGGNATLTNVTISGNRATSGGLAFLTFGSNLNLNNSIIWNNSSGLVLHPDFGGVAAIAYSLVEGCNPSGTWNAACGSDQNGNSIDSDPAFIAPIDYSSAPTASGNFRIVQNSPAVDVGNNAFNTTNSDLDGHARIFGSAIDLGGYEYTTYSLSTNIVGSGSISRSPDTIVYEPTITVTLVATANPGWTFAGWSGDLSGTTSTADLLISSTKVVTATFTNDAPTANAGPNQTVLSGSLVTLDGSASSDADPSQTLSYAWTQTAGTSVTLSDPTAQRPSFTAPNTAGVLTFALIVTDDLGASSSPISVSITVNTPPTTPTQPTTPTTQPTQPTTPTTQPTDVRIYLPLIVR
jgi:predicted outer membrane repeat protein